MLNRIVAVQECDPSSLRSSGQAARKHYSSNAGWYIKIFQHSLVHPESALPRLPGK